MPQTGAVVHTIMARLIATVVVALSQLTVKDPGEATVVATGVDHSLFVARGTL